MSTVKPMREFIVYKYVREKVLTDIVKDGGTADTFELTGVPKLRGLAAKAVEEWREAAQASANFTNHAALNPQLREELADVWEAVMFMREVLQTKPFTNGVLREDSQGYPKFRVIQRQWEELSYMLRPLDPAEDPAPWQKAVEELALLTTFSLHEHLPTFGLTFAQISAEGRKKRKLKGPLSPRFLRQATLPAESPWIKVFASKFTEKIPD